MKPANTADAEHATTAASLRYQAHQVRGLLGEHRAVDGGNRQDGARILTWPLPVCGVAS